MLTIRINGHVSLAAALLLYWPAVRPDQYSSNASTMTTWTLDKHLAASWQLLAQQQL